MRPLEVPANPLGAEHAAVEGKILPRLEPDHGVIFDLELNAALLTAETAMRLHHPVRVDRRIDPLAGRIRLERTKAGEQLRRERRGDGHRTFSPDRDRVDSSEALTSSAGRRLLPKLALRESEQLAAAGWADVLIVPAAVAHLIVVAQFPLDLNQIGDMQLGGERLAAPSALGFAAGRAGVAIKFHAELGGPLKDVEKFAEREPQQSEDDSHRVQDRQKFISVSFHPGVANRQ